MSANINKSFFTGRLARHPEIKTLEGGARVVKVTLCTSRGYHSKNLNQQVVDRVYIDMEAWDSGADTIVNNLQKGDFMSVECSVRQDRWVNAEGKKCSALKFRIDKFDYSRGRRNEPNEQVLENENEGGLETTEPAEPATV